MSDIAPSLTTSAARKPRARRLWALALLVILALIPLHWLLFQGQEVVPGVIARPVGPLASTPRGCFCLSHCNSL
jgi:hypothetical protein